jgi:serine/threonine-protein kinase
MFKALLKYLDATLGPAAGDAWLKATRMTRDDLEDETRPLPVAALHSALKEFVVATSRDAIQETWPYLLVPDNLGTWMRVLRGTTTPVDAFRRLDAGDGEYGRTTRWETLSAAASAGLWRGRVHVSHEAYLETDGLLRQARMTELRVVPALFGYERAAVVAVHGGEGSEVPGPLGAPSQDFEVRWSVPHVARASVLGAAAGGVLGSLPMVLHPSSVAAGWGAFAAALGGAVGFLVVRDRARRTETSAQTTRVRALERSLLLREARDTEASGLEGSVVAGQYRIAKRMGSGASGVIYQATRASDGLRVAIKLLRTVAAHDAVASDRLRREAEALRLAWHPNVVEVLDHGLLGDGTAYLVMELLLGESLATRIHDRGRLPPGELLPVVMRVCDALIAVHAAGVVHRDLKPSNIFLAVPAAPQVSSVAGSQASGDPGGERVKLIDFGIARVEWEETRITNTGVPIGTPGYMAPEQETGGEVDARSDIFALGACMYEALVGEPPPPVPSGLWVASGPPGPALSAGDGPKPAAARGAGAVLPPGWQAVVERAMAPLPRDRYPDARAFAQALRGLEAGLVDSGEVSSSR